MADTRKEPQRNELPLEEILARDPELPRSSPTVSFWQHVPHALAEVTSTSLPSETDFAVIGSGLTGLSVTKALLEQSGSRITVLEARTLCSGATGRNGGQLAINAAETYAAFKSLVGADMTGKIIHLYLRTLQRMREIAVEYASDAGELCEVTRLRGFKDLPSFEHIKAGILMMESDHPSLRGIYTVIDAETCEKIHGVHGVVGGVLHPAGTLWPYRVVTRVFEALMGKYSDRLQIETNTPVTHVSYDPQSNARYPYLLQTPRGAIRSARIAYCTNAYTSHLLPPLRGRVYPMKGAMTVQDFGNSVPNRGASMSWAIHYSSSVDPSNRYLADGLIYIAQNARTGCFFAGGKRAPIASILSADDSISSPSSTDFIQESLSLFFGCKSNKASRLISSWTGVMCFSSDRMPLVGRLPESVTGRAGPGEWMSGAYNGYGMPIAWSAGEALASMILGQAPPDWFPQAYLVTEERLAHSLSLQQSVAHVSTLWLQH